MTHLAGRVRDLGSLPHSDVCRAPKANPLDAGPWNCQQVPEQ